MLENHLTETSSHFQVRSSFLQLNHLSTTSYHSSQFTPTPTLAMATNALSAVYRYAIPLAIGVSLGQAAIYDVKGGTRAVIFDRLSGVKENVMNEGTHFLIPWLQKSIIYDVRTKPRNISTTTGSKDLQMVSLTLRVLHRPEVKMLPKIYQVCTPYIWLLQCLNSRPTSILFRTAPTCSFPPPESKHH